MMTLLGSLLGFGTSFLPEVLNFFKKSQENKHELQKIQLQMELMAKKSELKIQELDKEAEIKETEGLYQHDNVDAGGFINALRGSVRPIITYAFFALFVAIKVTALLSLMNQTGVSLNMALDTIWDDQTAGLFAAIMSFWFGNRAVCKYYKTDNMAEKNFEECLKMLLVHEGGFINHPRDPGGVTNLGVTKRVWEEWIGRKVSEQEMRNLKPSDVAPLYKKRYWDRCKCDSLPSGLDWAVFDWAVNSGTGRASKAVQKCCGAEPDGSIGPKTLALVEGQNTQYMIEKFGEIRQNFYESLSTFDTFGKGWTRRNKETTEKALHMI